MNITSILLLLDRVNIVLRYYVTPLPRPIFIQGVRWAPNLNILVGDGPCGYVKLENHKMQNIVGTTPKLTILT